MPDEKVGYSLASELPLTDERLPGFAEQRAERGFDDTETWSLACTIAKFTLPRLQRFREISKAHPGDRSECEWHAELDEIIWALQQIVDGDALSLDKVDRVEAALRKFGEDFLLLWW